MSGASLLDRIAAVAAARPEAPAIRFEERTVTYGELMSAADCGAGRLAALGIGHGARIGTLCGNAPEMLSLWLAAARLGAIFMPLNPVLTPAELAGILGQAAPAALVAEPRLRGALDAAAAAAGIAVPVLAPEALREPGPAAPPAGPGGGRDAVLLCYTSASTASPKGVLASHDSVTATARAFAELWSVEPGDRFLLALPLSYTYGLVSAALTALHAGASVLLLDRFDPGRLLAAGRRHGASILLAVPTMYAMIVEYAAATGRSGDLAGLRLAASAGARLDEATARRWAGLFPSPIQEFYGMSEVAPVTGCHLGRGDRPRPGTVGPLAPGAEARIVDAVGKPVPAGGEGTLLVRSPALMLGYWRRPDLDAQAWRDGWLDTGDRAAVDDDGYYRILGRDREIINRGGLKVSPAEVEAALLQHPAIAAAAVLGIPDPAFGEQVKAAVVLRPGGVATAAAIREHCRTRLADFKIPSQIVFLAALPVGPTGKIAKRDLVDAE
jgi:long-chain acyl-CoA synthetase